jgi:hypothetical protein
MESRSGGRGTSRWPTRRGRFRDLEWLRRRQIRWREWKRYPTRGTCARWDARASGPRMGWLAPGCLAHRGLPRPPARPVQRLLDRPRSARIHRALPPFPGPQRQPPDADPHVRWCGRHRVSPAPTRFSGSGFGGALGIHWAVQQPVVPDRGVLLGPTYTRVTDPRSQGSRIAMAVYVGFAHAGGHRPVRRGACMLSHSRRVPLAYRDEAAT